MRLRSTASTAGFSILDFMLVWVLIVGLAIAGATLAAAEASAQSRQAQEAWDGLTELQIQSRNGTQHVSQTMKQLQAHSSLAWTTSVRDGRQRVRLSGLGNGACRLVAHRLVARAQALAINDHAARDAGQVDRACAEQPQASVELDLAQAGDLRGSDPAFTRTTAWAVPWKSDTGF